MLKNSERMKFMKQMLLGYSEIDFTKDGDRVLGTKIFTSYESRSITAGQETANIFLRPDMIPGGVKLSGYLGFEIDVEFDQRGRVIGLYFPESA